MYWGAFHGQGPVAFVHVPGTLTAERYVGILEMHLLPFMDGHRDYVFQQDNATSHSAQRTRNWLNNNGVIPMNWPPNSPDLNPIENIWSFLKQQVDQREIHGFQQLNDVATDIFNSLPQDFILQLIASMPRRVQAVLDKHGGHTNY